MTARSSAEQTADRLSVHRTEPLSGERPTGLLVDVWCMPATPAVSAAANRGAGLGRAAAGAATWSRPGAAPGVRGSGARGAPALGSTSLALQLGQARTAKGVPARLTPSWAGSSILSCPRPTCSAGWSEIAPLQPTKTPARYAGQAWTWSRKNAGHVHQLVDLRGDLQLLDA